ncbi:FMRFamide receptor-like [Ruditapes philippinarum]|uniref:FMRFamide receptor-like n=1 Tax=Ruditapes philippinarum TaxID=129788 RepID=UPI00295B4AB6|nr:FMRFamide receptor-like [Ruditapes philippinarum]
MFPNISGSTDTGGTNSSLQTGTVDGPITWVTLVERFTIPVICVLGLVGNTCSIVIFLQKSLRKKSCSLFLASRSISDNGFILILLIVWVTSALDLKLSRISGICQSLIFLTYVFGCLSVWLVVFVTIENYVRICKPYMVKRICKASNAKGAVVILFICVLCSYNFPLWTFSDECVPNEKHYSFIRIMVYADSILTLVFPTLIMSVLMTKIAMTSLQACRFRRRLSLTSVQRKSSSPMTKVTTMLLAVTLIFFILNMPSHVVRLRLMVIAFTEDESGITGSLDLTLHSISQLIYYLSLAINIFVYYFFGSTFRKAFFKLFHWNGKYRCIQVDSSGFLETRCQGSSAFRKELVENNVFSSNTKDNCVYFQRRKVSTL